MTEIDAPPVLRQDRPTLVWVIFVFYIATGGWGLVLQLLMFAGLYTLSPEQQALVGDQSAATHIFLIVVGVLNLAAATTLWQLRKVAFPLFTAVLVLGVGSTVWHLLPGGMYSRMFAQGAIMAFVSAFSVGVGVLILFAIWGYVFVLWRRGTLK